MRTTINVEDELLRRAKHRAVAAGISLSEYVTRALREALRESPRQDRAPYRMGTFGDPEPRTAHEPADFAAALDEDDVEAFG